MTEDEDSGTTVFGSIMRQPTRDEPIDRFHDSI